MIPAQVFCRVVRVISELNRPGSGFLFDHADGLALVTAAHLTSGAPEELVTMRQAWGEGEPVTEYLDLIGSDQAADVPTMFRSDCTNECRVGHVIEGGQEVAVTLEESSTRAASLGESS